MTSQQKPAIVNISKLCAAADYYAQLSHTVSRFYMNEVERLKVDLDVDPTSPTLSCQYCGTIFRPDNHQVRFIPRVKTSSRVQRHLQRHANCSRPVGKLQQRLLELYRQRNNRMVVTCLTCDKRTVIACHRKPERTWPVTQPVENVQEMTMTKSMRKKLKRKLHGQRIPGGNADSGLDLSYSMSSSSTSLTKLGAARYTSTPVTSASDNKRSKSIIASMSGATSLPPVSLLAGTTSNRSSCGRRSKMTVPQTRIRQPHSAVTKNKQKMSRKERSKQTHSMLQHMLSQEQSKDRAKTGGSLKDFLSCV